MRFALVIALAWFLLLAGGTAVSTEHETAKTTKTASVLDTSRASAPLPLEEDEEGWACWSQGNRTCSTVPLGHRDGPTTGAVCTTDADCEAYDRARGIVAWT